MSFSPSPSRSPALRTLKEDAPLEAQTTFDVVAHYRNLLENDPVGRDMDSLGGDERNMSMPIAAVETLAELVAQSDSSSTTTELLTLLRTASAKLAQACFNPISPTSGTSLFIRFLTLQRPAPEMSFEEFKMELVNRAREFVRGSGRCRDLISKAMFDFVQDGSTILVHSYSRVVVQALLYAAERKKRFQVYVTESRPFGLGLKTHAILQEAGIPCVVCLDSAVCYIMPKCDMVIVGAEAVCESGGLVNFIGGYTMAIAAKAMNKPLYALAESFKFTRLFPLSQYDLPSSLPSAPLTFAPDAPRSQGNHCVVPPTPSRPMTDSKMPDPLELSDEQIRHNPILDYTTPDLISLVVSDLGCLTPSGVSDALLSIFGGE
ncbi:translation initiation factor eIF-2B subunit alpha [Microbotryomycetes sp. JL221]|nr:translation initiation factor eIF-2B subunit alpha [Microbotryomycetes sp. JL221]